MTVYTGIWKIFTNKLLRSNKILSILILLCLIITVLIILLINVQGCDCNSVGGSLLSQSTLHDQHELCLIIPFRDRFDELLIFLMHMKVFLERQNIVYHVYVVNQVDSYRFNRGSLINVGFLYIRENTHCDFIAMHDVDLIPINPRLNYSYPGDAIMHIAAPDLHPKYHYKTFLGGILMMKNEHFQTVNGLSNKYWGWGLEDDELYVRIKEARIRIERPENVGSGIDNTFRHVHDKARRRRDMQKCYNQKEVTRKRDRDTGLHNVQYDIPSHYVMHVNGSSAVILNVALRCNHTLTPWCVCKGGATAAKVGPRP
ncbi:hypothetical protein M8J75_010680 [Diaphorina citri]|nr:hypothetical protein M8J75_010680 [Diaphorina citri]